MNRLSHDVGGIAQDRRGGLAIIAAAAMLPTVLVLGAAIDIGNAYATKARIQAAADSAVLAGLSEAKSAYGTKTGTELTDYVRDTMVHFYHVNAGRDVSGFTFNPVINVEVVDNVMTTHIEYEGSRPAYFLGLIGVDEIEIGGASEATASLLQYVDMHILVDASGSMGIGATTQDQIRMYDEMNCAFACHTGGNQGYNRARSIGANTRIDIARYALEQAMGEIQTIVSDPEQVRFGQYRFSSWLTTNFEVDHPQSSNFDWVKRRLDNGVVMDQNGSGTNLNYSLGQLEQQLNDLSSAYVGRTRRQFVFIITDGIEDPNMNTGSWRNDPNFVPFPPFLMTEGARNRLQNVNPAMCESLKRMGYEVAILYTPYVIPPNDRGQLNRHDVARFGFIESTLLPTATDHLKACASEPEYFYVASDPDEIDRAVQKFFYQAIVPTHLTQ